MNSKSGGIRGKCPPDLGPLQASDRRRDTSREFSPHGGTVTLEGLATIQLKPAHGKGTFSPDGFRWKLDKHRASLEALYEIAPIPVPGSTAALHKIYLEVVVLASE